MDLFVLVVTLAFGISFATLYFRGVRRKPQGRTRTLPPESVDAITTNDPDIIHEILVQQDEVFASRPRTLAGVHLAYGCGDVALAPLGLHWSTKRIESFANHRVDEAKHLIQDVLARSKAGEVNLRQVLGAFSMNNVTRMLLGKQYFGVKSAGPESAMEFMDITHELFRLLGVIYLGDYLPLWRWFDPFGCEKEMRDVEKRMDEFHKTILEEHRKKERLSALEESEIDFVDILLGLPGEDRKEHLEDVEIKALVQDMIAAATDTSSVTNEWAMAEVIKHPRVLLMIQEELDSVAGRDRMVTESDLSHLSYLRCVVRETFRMHPAGPFLIPHESVKATESTATISRKRHVYLSTLMHLVVTHVLRRTSMNSDQRDISMGEISGFYRSAPVREGPGAPLGVFFVLMGLARLFHCFDWGPPDGLKPEDIDTTEVYGMTMPEAKPLIAVAKSNCSHRSKPRSMTKFDL
ncbi:hypothetical protein MKX01_020495 [Papaver californicum]|nr:hypothetical protein MKX01_020495 [Papaver californicum]